MVSTVALSCCDVQFNGHASWIWYSHDPLVALQKPTFDRIPAGNSVSSGEKCQVPMDVAMMVAYAVT